MVTNIPEAISIPITNGPGGHKLRGNLPEFSRNRLSFLTHCARDYGDFVALKFFSFPIYLVSHPQLIEEILVTQNKSFIKGRGLGRTHRILGNGLLTSEGDFWRRQRRLAQPAFRPQRIEGYSEIMSDFTRLMLEAWKDGQSMDIHEEMMTLTLLIVSRALFDTDVSASTDRVKASLDVGLKHFNSGQSRLIPEWFPTPGNLRFEQAARQLDEIVYGFIRQRRTDSNSYGDLLDTLLHARDEDGNQMTDRQLRDEIMTIFLAGHETTANALSWTWMLLSLNPEVEAHLHAELEGVLHGRTPTVEDLPALSYNRRVIQESLRLYPPAYIIGREASQDVKIGGNSLPAGTNFLMSQWVVHHDERFFPEPERFQPERWTPEFSASLPTYAYFPFGGGPRLCIGKPFALQEAELVLATMAQHWQLRLLNPQAVAPQPSITLRPRGGIHMVAERR